MLHGGLEVKYAWKMKSWDKEKWYVLYARDPGLKEKWMEYFMWERARVADDHEKGTCMGILVVPVGESFNPISTLLSPHILL